MAVLLPEGKQSFTTNGSLPLSGGKVYTYEPGTSTPKDTFTTSAGTVANTNPVILDTRGEATIFWSGAYDVILKTAADVTIWGPIRHDTPEISGAAADVLADLADTASAANGDALIGVKRTETDAVATTLHAWIQSRPVSVIDFGADPTGVALSNTAFTAAKAASKTLYLPPGTYRLEGWTAQDVRLIGARASGANTGANEQTVIEGSGDLLTGANNFSMEHLVIRNSSAGTRGKLVTVSAIDTKLGPFIDVEFRKATYHIFQNDATKTIVDGIFRDCRFSDANTYSRHYLGGLFRYTEEDCYTATNKRGMLISSTSAAEIGGVFEVQDEGAIYVTNTSVATDTVRSLKFKNIHFENNGNVTPTADVTINVSLSLARIEFDSCGFYLPTVTNPVDLASSPTLRIFHHNCTDISFTGIASGTVIASAVGKRAGSTDGFLSQNGDIGVSGGMFYADGGFRALSGISVTITGSATPTPIAMPSAGAARLVLVADSTTAGAALLLLNNGVVTSISSTLTSISWTVVSNVLNGNTTGGASSRTLYFNYIAT